MPLVEPGDDGQAILWKPDRSTTTPPDQKKPDMAPGPSPRDPFSAYERGSVNTAHDQVLALLEQFQQIMGWPAGIDEQALEMELLQNGLYLSPERAYNFLFQRISPDLQKANPNAEFGMTYDTYITTLNAFKDAFLTLAGTPDIPHDVLRMAIDQQWTQAELTEFLKTDKRYIDPSQAPWLQQGMTFKDVRNQFASIYGKNPVDPRQLASWFSFRQGAQSVGTGQPAKMGPSQGPAQAPSLSEVR